VKLLRSEEAIVAYLSRRCGTTFRQRLSRRGWASVQTGDDVILSRGRFCRSAAWVASARYCGAWGARLRFSDFYGIRVGSERPAWCDDDDLLRTRKKCLRYYRNGEKTQIFRHTAYDSRWKKKSRIRGEPPIAGLDTYWTGGEALEDACLKVIDSEAFTETEGWRPDVLAKARYNVWSVNVCNRPKCHAVETETVWIIQDAFTRAIGQAGG